MATRFERTDPAEVGRNGAQPASESDTDLTFGAHAADLCLPLEGKNPA